ncbi:hypothetical protein BRC94_07595 [Halobacteriales archaeon QS_5_70_17]|nr:MAG: hypothetical protein BRC94_07595 [Halobacteriales archaeon QS_5_70_17]
MGANADSTTRFDDWSLRRRVAWWVLVEGDRTAVAGGLLLAGVIGLAAALVAEVITVGYGSNVRRLFASGMAAGLLSLITVALSINQLILSRVFGAPDALGNHFDGTLSLQQTIEKHTDREVAPGAPAAMLRTISDGLDEHAGALPADSGLGEYGDRISAYADAASSFDGENGREATSSVLSTILTTGYARDFIRTREIQATRNLAPAVERRLESIRELLRAMAIFRQYLKTIVIQQQLAELSRLIVYTGVAGVAVALSLAMVYRTSTGAAIPPGWLPAVTTLGFAVMLAPLAVLVSYVLQAATIARYTVSAGPIIPPEETIDR